MTKKERLIQEIQAFESLYKVTIPSDFKEYLLEFDGFKLTKRLIDYEHPMGTSQILVNQFFPFSGDDNQWRTIIKIYIEHEAHFEKHIPFANDHGGAYLILSLNNDETYGEIYFYTMEDVIGSAVKVSSSFSVFLNSLRNDEGIA